MNQIETNVIEEKTESSLRKILFSNLDFYYSIGLIFLIISSLIFYFNIGNKDTNGIFKMDSHFLLNYSLAAAYSMILSFNGISNFFKKQKNKNALNYSFLAWNLWIVSCFSLNNDIQLFYKSTDWFSAAICLSVLLNILYSFKSFFGNILNNIYYFLLTFTCLLWMYFALYLLPLYPISVPGLILLGISIHTYIPLFISISLLKEFYKVRKAYFRPIVAGFSFCIIAIISFSVVFTFKVSEISKLESKALVSNNNDLPNWIKIAKQTEQNWITEKVLKSDLVYQKNITDSWSFMPNFNLQDEFKHDPLILIASLFSPKLELSPDEKIKILDSRFDFRDSNEDRLWSGENLSIPKIITQTKIYPQYRLAYTEKTITIHNSGYKGSWNTQEAIFTFYVPEGTAVSSLSLWINGVEEKGILTTQGKAETAYKTIVGVENRDPSIVQWQEGNRISVKVFPCTPIENRRFKIGFTSPLNFDVKNNILSYQNIYFKGPSTSSTKESVFLDLDQKVNNLKSSRSWDENNQIKMSADGNYKADWKLEMEAPVMSLNGFNFNGKSYEIFDYKVENEKVKFDNIFLDIDKSWTLEDVDKIINMAPNAKVFTWNDGMILLNKIDLENQISPILNQEFSLFPITKIKNIETSLLISKKVSNSPILKELENSELRTKLKDFKPSIPVRTYVLEGISPYLKTLQELRLIRCEYGDWDRLKLVLSQNIFPKNIEDEKTSLIKSSNMGIKESLKNINNKAPDHILRLFTYNQVLKQLGSSYFDKQLLEDKLLNTAALGNVVTPISSLIVLESQKDYDRFNIKKLKNSLDNATFKKAGAVPEPHEWALIILVLIIVTYNLRKKLMLKWI